MLQFLKSKTNELAILASKKFAKKPSIIERY
jgi:hypothetical protein